MKAYKCSRMDEVIFQANSEIDYLSFNQTNSSAEANDSYEHLVTATIRTALWVLQLILVAFISLTTIFGNLLVIFVFTKEKKLQKYSNYFILNLSIADLLIGFLILPYVFLSSTGDKLFCICFLIFDYAICLVSVLCIVVISFDRYFLVSKGLDYLSNQKVSHAIFINITVWGKLTILDVVAW